MSERGENNPMQQPRFKRWNEEWVLVFTASFFTYENTSNGTTKEKDVLTTEGSTPKEAVEGLLERVEEYFAEQKLPPPTLRQIRVAAEERCVRNENRSPAHLKPRAPGPTAKW